MSTQLPPVRCQTCGKLIASLTEKYWSGLEEGLGIEKAFERTGISTRKICCVMSIRGAVPPWCHAPEQRTDFRKSDFYTYIKPTQTVRHVSSN
jgi:DNA-directed RNA polymerase subunit N (RpoN/RPB10)